MKHLKQQNSTHLLMSNSCGILCAQKPTDEQNSEYQKSLNITLTTTYHKYINWRFLTYILILILIFTVGCSDKFTIKEAREIAEASECTAEATLSDQYIYNEITKTYWIDLNLVKEGCNPACVVSEETKTAEINWRCTGTVLIEISEIDEAKATAEDAITHMAQFKNYNGRELMMTHMMQNECEGCFEFMYEFKKNADVNQGTDLAKVRIIIENWEVTQIEYEQTAI